MKVSEITYKSKLSDFLDMSKVEEKIAELDSVISLLQDNIIADLTICMATGGGLDPNSLQLEGDSPLNKKAEECKSNFETVIENCNNLKIKILDSASGHREEELTTFISCLEERIEIVKKEIAKLGKKIEEMNGNIAYMDTIAFLSHQKRQYEVELNGLLFDGLYDTLDKAKQELKKVTL